MALHALNKGKEGEREIARALNEIIFAALQARGIAIPDRDVVQRNQNQSAVGGGDLSNTFGMCIEVKRQEQLSVNTWWKQVQKAALHNGDLPVLVYRQNRKPWRVVTIGNLPCPYTGHQFTARVEFAWEDFKLWFRYWVDLKLENGEKFRV